MSGLLLPTQSSFRASATLTRCTPPMAAASLKFHARRARCMWGGAWRPMHFLGLEALTARTFDGGRVVERLNPINASADNHGASPLSDDHVNPLKHDIVNQWSENANLFGAVVDNSMLEKMPKYAGKTITKEDRAQEALNLIDADGKKNSAISYVRNLNKNYGYGVTTLCIVYNSTGDTLSLVTSNDWNGHIGNAPYPMEIGNGQWAAFLHVHSSGAATGSVAGIVYRANNKNGHNKDCLLTWCTPWSMTQSNKAYCAIGNVNYFNLVWDSSKTKLEDSSYYSTAMNDGCQVDARTETGTSPLYTATIAAR